MTAHTIARDLLRQFSAVDAIRDAALDAYGTEPRFYLDDDDPEDPAPHIIATPDSSADGHGPDGEYAIRVVVSARDFEGDGIAPEIDPDGGAGCFHIPAADRFDEFAQTVWDAVREATPGAILLSREAEWSFAGFQPLRFAVFTFTYRTIHAFGD
jgi:hypothetical protein